MHYTDREKAVMELLLQGMSNTEMAKELNIGVRTVKQYLHVLYIKFGIETGIKRVKLTAILYKRQLCTEIRSAQEHSHHSNASLQNLSLTDIKTKTLPRNSISLNM